jgi:PAS domain S-box-containing protein
MILPDWADRLWSPGFSPTDGPLVRDGLARRSWPFALAGVIAAIMVTFPGSHVTDPDDFIATALATVLLLAVTLLAPWPRLPLWTQSIVPIALLGVIGLLRESTGAVGGFAVLVILPVLWLALYGTRSQLVVSIVASIGVFLVPIVLVGAPRYPASGISRIVLWPVTAAIVGVTTYRLVAAERARTSFVDGILAAATQQSIIATDPDGTITVFNAGAERMYGYTATEMVGRSTPLTLHDPAEVAARAAELDVDPGFEVFSARARGGEADTREWTYITRDGSRLKISLSVTPIVDDTGVLRGFIKIGTDVTERTAAEALKDEFVALVSHELRTPLSSIIGYLEVLLDEDETGALSPRQRHFLDVVDRNARRQLRLVSDLLFVSQVDAGRVHLDLADGDLAELASAAVEVAVPRAKAGGVTVTLHGDESVPARVDADRIGQVFDNLLTNAIKFTPPGGQVDVTVTGSDRGARIVVADTGVGIPVAEQHQLFTRFFRASTATSRAIPGVGLGLTIVKAIVDAHRGTMTVSSGADAGTTFGIELPQLAAIEDTALVNNRSTHGAHRERG